MKKRILSVLLAGLLLMGLLPLIGAQAAPTVVGVTVSTQNAFVGDTLIWTVNAEVPAGHTYQTRIDVLVDGVTKYNGLWGSGTYSYKAVMAGEHRARAWAIDNTDNATLSQDSVATKVSLKPGPTITSVASINHTSMALTWTAVPGAAGYKVFTATVPGGPYTLRRYATGTTAPISFLTPGVRVFFKVSAYIESGGKKYDLTLQSPYKIGVPVGTASITKVENNAAGRVFLAWKFAPGATGYEVWRSTNSTSGFVRIKSVTTTNYLDTNLVRGRSYYYKIMPYARVFAVNYYGQWSMLRSIKILK